MDREQQVEWAKRYLVDGWQSPGGDHCEMWGIRKWTEIDRGGQDRTTPPFWHTLPSRILAASPHLQGISGHESRLDELLKSMPLMEALEIIDKEFLNR